MIKEEKEKYKEIIKSFGRIPVPKGTIVFKPKKKYKRFRNKDRKKLLDEYYNDKLD